MEVSSTSPSPNFRHREGRSRRRAHQIFYLVCVVTAGVSVLALVALLCSIIIQGVPYLTPKLLTNGPEPDAAEAGVWPALAGTGWVCALCALFAFPTGIATAILLEEYKPRSRVGNWLYGLITLNISNLAGVPSVVYGIIGLTAFVSMFEIFGSSSVDAPAFEFGANHFDQFYSEGDQVILVPVEDPSKPSTRPVDGMAAFDFDMRPIQMHVIGTNDPLPEDEQMLAYTLLDDAEAGRINRRNWYYFRLPLGRGVLAGGLTLMLVILPVVIISSQEALRAVPSTLRDGARGLGATPWQVIWNVTLPASIPGMMTGIILAMSRAIGEAAPILIIAGIVYINRAPQHLMDDFSVMPMQIFNWTARPQEEFHGLAAAAIVVLMAILMVFNGLAIWIRLKFQKPLG
jgi:phosphate transport system permease protein